MIVDATPSSWIIETRNTAYALGFNASGALLHRYWGRKLPQHSDYPEAANHPNWSGFDGPQNLWQEEFPVYGGMSYVEPCLKTTFADGTRDTVLEFVKSETTGQELQITLKDSHYPLEVVLHYRVFFEQDLIVRYITLKNLGSEKISLERIFSAQWHFPLHDTYQLTHLSGRWNDEYQIRREQLNHGTKVLESRRLTSSHHHNPWFALERGDASETHGAVWFGALAWSGNWKLTAEVTDFHATRVSMGLNDWDFALELHGGETFVSPEALGGFSLEGYGGASRLLHDHIRQNVIPHGPVAHKVLYNSWEATFFDVTEAGQGKLAELAAEMGIELFVLDDGWFQGRHSDQAALGDWWPDAGKFPNGLQPLIDKVKALGMDFGLWIEPEMVNPDSDLYRAHPDWAIHFPTRARTTGRNQLILNLAKLEVQNYLIEMLDKLLAQHPISFIKWDMNRNVSEPGWAEHPQGKEIWVRYVEGLYHVWDTLRLRHPNIFWQSCSGGGGRADLGILTKADQIWTSDNTEPAARLSIQEGFSLAYPALVMEAWVTDMGTAPLEFRLHVSMLGALGIGADLTHWNESERALAAHWIAYYKTIREVVQLGDQYRLRSDRDLRGLHGQVGNYSSWMYLSKDKTEGVLFDFRTHLSDPVVLPAIKLCGLEPESRYQLEGHGTRSGLAWMEIGVHLHPLTETHSDFGDRSSSVLKIKKVG
jgi:alpha-galactosidase